MRPIFRLLTVSLLLLSCHASADDAVAAKMRALFPKADADQSGTLSAAEQARAVEFVKTTYGATILFQRAG